MQTSVNLYGDSFQSIQAFSAYLSEQDNIMPSSYGVFREQVAPRLYLVNNDKVEVKGLEIAENKVVFQAGTDDLFVPTVSVPGTGLNIISSAGKVLLIIEKFGSLLADRYNIEYSRINIFLVINREDIVGFSKQEKATFYAVNQKQSVAFRHNARRRGAARGILPNLIVRGVTAATGSLENDLRPVEGSLYSLSFLKDGVETSIDVVAEQVWETAFEAYLDKYWSTVTPDIQVATKKEGCYIATACYQSYEHPSVMVLRNFRDKVLLQYSWGRKFTRRYYKYSPYWAEKLRQATLVNKLVRIILLDPLVKLVFNFSTKK